jgi:hypothetical protein
LSPFALGVPMMPRCRPALGVLISILVCGVGAARAEIVLQSRRDLGVGASPTAFTLLGTSPPTVLVATAQGLASFRYEQDAGLAAGPRNADGRGAQILVAGPLGANGEPMVAFASRDAARVAVASIDARGAIGARELIEVPALPRAAHIAPLHAGGPSALFVAHDDGVSIVLNGSDGWRRREIAAPAFAPDLAVADLDGDGTTDLLVVDEGANQLVVLHGLGDGGFESTTRLSTARTPQRVVVADLNGDGHPDVLVVAHDGVFAHLANPNGGFGAPQPVRSGDHIVDVAAADVNGDRRTDLAILDRSHSTLTFLLATEDGHYTAGESYLVGYGADATLLADFDGDGKPDALTLNKLGDNVTLLRGRGGGHFEGIICLNSDIGDLTAVAVEDFNGDEHPDLAVASEDGGRLAIFLGRGDGRFDPPSTISVGRQPRALVASDLNQDGIPDLAVVNFGGDAVSILLGDGRGGFAPPRTVAVGTGPSAISVGSFSSDTGNDLAIVNSLSNSVSVLYGDGHGQFPNVATFPVTARPSFLIVGDTNRDGHQDLVVGSEFSESVAILLGDGRRLGEPTTNKLSGTARPSLAEDFDRDGQIDLVNPDESAGLVQILPGTGEGQFGRPIQLAVGRDPHAVVAADFDHDGRMDLAVVHRATRTIAILLNHSPSKAAPRTGQRAAGGGAPGHS